MTSAGRSSRAFISASQPSEAEDTSYPAASSSEARASRLARLSSAMRIFAAIAPFRLRRQFECSALQGRAEGTGFPGDKLHEMETTGGEGGGRFASFADFYPFYLSQHADRTSRRLHFTGTSLGL